MWNNVCSWNGRPMSLDSGRQLHRHRGKAVALLVDVVCRLREAVRDRDRREALVRDVVPHLTTVVDGRLGRSGEDDRRVVAGRGDHRIQVELREAVEDHRLPGVLRLQRACRRQRGGAVDRSPDRTCGSASGGSGPSRTSSSQAGPSGSGSWCHRAWRGSRSSCTSRRRRPCSLPGMFGCSALRWRCVAPATGRVPSRAESSSSCRPLGKPAGNWGTNCWFSHFGTYWSTQLWNSAPCAPGSTIVAPSSLQHADRLVGQVDALDVVHARTDSCP